jgi:hypothetical protein
VTFKIDVTSGQARGHVRGIYRDLVIAVLDKQTGSEKGFDNRVASFFANLLKIRSSNAPNNPVSMKEGKVNYARRPEDTFLRFAWVALRSGVVDIISQ